jgi:DNA-binding response OmpR family regulator
MMDAHADKSTDRPPKTVLIVDDAMDMRVFISALFKTSGFNAVACRDGAAGIEKARQIQPDLIILDVMMPGTGGVLMYKQLRTDRRLDKVPVIMLSAVGQRSFRHYLRMLNAKLETPLPDPDTYLEKPPDAGQLLKTAKQLMAERDA